MVQFYLGKREFNQYIARRRGVGDAMYEEAKSRAQKARRLLAQVRATTTHEKIHGPSHQTWISAMYRDNGIDAEFSLNAPNALAEEYGHDPSGVFAGTDTKSPDGLFILTRAAYG